MSEPKKPHEVLAEGKFLRLVRKDRWEHVERTNCTEAVVIAGVTDRNEVIFVEQYRPPVKANVIEFPAGLVGDIEGQEAESYALAAERELLEETGYKAGHLEVVARGPISPGLSTETIVLLLGSGLRKVDKGGGDGTENITVHAVPFERVEAFLKLMQAQDHLIDPKIYSGLYFIRQKADATSHRPSSVGRL